MGKKFVSSGFSIIELLVASALLSVLIMGLASLMRDLSREKRNHRVEYAIENLKKDIINIIRDDRAWKKTIEHPKNLLALNCLKTSFNCHLQQRQTEGLILIPVLVNGANEVMLESHTNDRDDIQGFDEFANSCRGFDNRYQDKNLCPFRYVLSWRPLCENTETCINPSAEVTGVLEYTGDISRLQPGKYRFRIIRPNLIQSSNTWSPQALLEKNACEAQGKVYKNGFCNSRPQTQEKGLKAGMCPAIMHAVSGKSISVPTSKSGESFHSQPLFLGQTMITNGEFYCDRGHWLVKLPPKVVDFADPKSLESLLKMIQ